jgi:TolB-like protein/DNA-binding winged helix-turn-helix (wHTH) protein/Tfp pilus assembly protein PilF
MQQLRHQALSFGDFTLDLTRGCLFRGDVEIKLRPKSFEVLKYLVEHGGQLVGKEELIRAVWAGTAVTDDSLVQCLIEIRRALGDGGQQLVKTVPRRGYLLDALVTGYEPPVREVVYTEEVEDIRVTVEEEEERMVSRDEAVTVLPASGAKLLRGGIRRHKLIVLLIPVLLGAAIIAYFVIPRYFTRNDRANVPPPGDAGAIRSIAVLPFTNASNNPDTEYLSDGISESLINSLSQLPGLKVIARSSSFKYKGREVDPQEIANALGVEAILTGHVTQHGDDLLISVELVNARDKTQVWGAQYNRKGADLLAVLSEIPREIAEKLRLRLTSGEQQKLAKFYTSNSEAYNYYAKAMYHFHNIRADVGTRPEADLAVDLFKEAIKLDPNYALAHAQLGYTYARIAVFLEDSPTLIEQAKEELAVAERLDPQLAEVHTARYFIEFSQYGGWRVGAAFRELRLAQQLDPNVGHAELADLYAHIGLEQQAVEEFETALKADPNNDEIKVFYINSYFLLAKPDEALEVSRRFFNRGPDFQYYMEKRMVKEAEALIGREFQKEPRASWALVNRALLLALQGKQKEAEAATSTILKGRRNRGYHHVTYNLARIYALGGKSAEALKWLRVTVEEGFPCYPLFAHDPFLDPIRCKRSVAGATNLA